MLSVRDEGTINAWNAIKEHSSVVQRLSGKTYDHVRIHRGNFRGAINGDDEKFYVHRTLFLGGHVDSNDDSEETKSSNMSGGRTGHMKNVIVWDRNKNTVLSPAGDPIEISSSASVPGACRITIDEACHIFCDENHQHLVSLR